MGGHGALICALKNPGAYRSVSASRRSAIRCSAAGGKAALPPILVDDRRLWEAYDAVALIRAGARRLRNSGRSGHGRRVSGRRTIAADTLQSACEEAGMPRAYACAKATTTATTSSRPLSVNISPTMRKHWVHRRLPSWVSLCGDDAPIMPSQSLLFPYAAILRRTLDSRHAQARDAVNTSM